MTNPIPADVIEAVQDERTYQLEHGRKGKLDGEDGWSYKFDDANTPNDWVSYITSYAGRAVPIGLDSEGTAHQFRQNMLKVAALACAAVEAVDRNRALPPRHYDSVPTLLSQ